MTVTGGFPALAGVDLDVAEGDVVLLTGPNGAGKTTLLRLMAGLAPLTGGEGMVLGFHLGRDRRAVRRHVALLGHESGCYEDLTPIENVRFQARAAGRSAAAADAALDHVGLGRARTTPYRLLSAGQRRRVALAIVIARDAQLLLLDEPHAGLDAAGRAVLDAIVSGGPVDGRTVVVASHELSRARPLATREVAMAGGHIVPATASNARPVPLPALVS